MEALKYGPLQVTVYAWNHEEDGVYPNPKNKYRNHAVTLVGFDEGSHWIIFDHYNQSVKKLAWDYEFGHALRYTVSLNKPTQPMPMELDNDLLIKDAEDTGMIALHLNGELRIDDRAKILAEFISRNDGDIAGKIVNLPKEEWDLFPKKNLKGEPLE